ncbi:MAG: hypothetical protein IT160_16215 [Bryobacterales bacterium]|nr:hypothetical protein [Bryobacterales bacterium]
MNRRKLLWGVAAAPLASSQATFPVSCVAGEGTIRDRLWLFGCPANTDFGSLQRRSLMTPAEGALYLGISNLIVVQAGEHESRYGRLEPPFEQYAIALRPFKRVVWSLVGSGGFTSEAERNEGLELAKKTPNFTGVMFDDFFQDKPDGKRAVLTVEETGSIRRQLKESGKKLDSFVTFYMSSLGQRLSDYLELFDVITLWSSLRELENLEANFRRVEQATPRSRKMLGCYMVDYGGRCSLPVELMRKQTELGLRWLREKRIEGIVFLGNTCEDLGFEAVEWTREWIRRNGDTKL